MATAGGKLSGPACFSLSACWEPDMLQPHSLYLTMLGRALRLRCPRCGEGMLFLGWFHMRSRCDWCGLIYEREPGFFLGSIYVNYGLTAVLTTAGLHRLVRDRRGLADAICCGG